MKGLSVGSDSSPPVVRPKRITTEKQSSPTSAVSLYPVVFDVTDNNSDCCEGILMECLSWCAGDGPREPAPIEAEFPSLPDLSILSAPAQLTTSARSRSDTAQSSISSTQSSRTTATGRRRQPGNKKQAIRHRRARSDGQLMASSSSCTSATWVDEQENFETHYVLTRQIVQGNKSSVWECVQRSSGQRYAVKIAKPSSKHVKELQYLQEAQAHPNVIKFVECFQSSKLYFVTEFVPRSLLSTVVQDGPLDEALARHVVSDLLHALTHLHKLNMIHSDIQPSNVLLSYDNTVKICDFGTINKQIASSGSPYRAPDKTLTVASDMWSVGAVLYFGLNGHEQNLKRCELLHRLSSPSLPFSRPTKRFLINTVHHDPEIRYTVSEALRSSFLSSGKDRKPRLFRWKSREE